jgi:hypothetical protein
MRHHRFSGSCGTPSLRNRFPGRTCLMLTLYWRVVLIVCFKLCLNVYFLISRLHPLPRNYGESRNRKMTLKEFSTWMIIRCGEIQLGVRPVSNTFGNYVGITILTTRGFYSSANLHVLNSCGTSISDVRKADACFLSDQLGEQLWWAVVYI